MNYQEKITFCKEHLGEEVEFSDSETLVHWNPSKLGGFTDFGFTTAIGTEWKFCRLIPKPQFIDWTVDTAESVQLRHRASGAKVWMNYDREKAWFENIEYTEEISYPTLFKEWETVDGRPCGTEVKDD
jgi:hypothetical protein